MAMTLPGGARFEGELSDGIDSLEPASRILHLFFANGPALNQDVENFIQLALLSDSAQLFKQITAGDAAKPRDEALGRHGRHGNAQCFGGFEGLIALGLPSERFVPASPIKQTPSLG
jgi:hypothetical protein